MFEQMLSLGYAMERSENKNYRMKGITIGSIYSARDKIEITTKKCPESITCRNFSLYPSDSFLSHRGEKSPVYRFQQVHVYSDCSAL